MLFKKHDGRKKGGGILTVFRLLLSLVIIAILGIGLLQAVRSFSGVDPLKLSPKAGLKSLLTSKGAVEFVTGLLSVSPADSLEKAKQALKEGTPSNPPESNKPSANLSFKFAVVADSHKDTANLEKALSQAKESGVKFVIGIGDFSDVGTVEELKNTKSRFEVSGLSYYVIPGDHDLWDSRNQKNTPTKNFSDVFGQTYTSFSYENIRFLMIDDSDNYLGLDGLQLKWVEDELEREKQNPSKALFVFSSTPFYHPSSDHFMGKVTPRLKDQADHLNSILKRAGAKQLFFADTHFFSRYNEPVNDLKMVTVGAVTSDRNIQSPRYALVDVFDDGSYNIEEVEIKQ